MLALFIMPENVEYLIELDTPASGESHSSGDFALQVLDGESLKTSFLEDNVFKEALDFTQTLTDTMCAEILVIHRVGAGIVNASEFSNELARTLKEGQQCNRNYVAEKIGMGYCIKGLKILKFI